LIEGRNGRSVPNLAGLLLFGKNPPRWHPRPGLDFLRWEGTERKFGTELNIAKRFRIELPLVSLIQRTYEAIQPFLQQLGSGRSTRYQPGPRLNVSASNSP
jgi:ATP-dependent DNA helicase RecG